MKEIIPKILLLLGFSLVFIGVYLTLTQLQNSIPQQQVAGVVRRKDMYPNPELTPGDVFPTVTVEEICAPKYTTKVRNVSLKTKKEVYAAYDTKFPQPTGSYELDHFIPLAIGGSNDKKNLWPEPAEPRPGYHEKDIVEVYLHEQLCAGKIELKAAQEAVRTDWYTVYEQIQDKKKYDYNSD